MAADVQSHRTMTYNLEVTSQDMHRYVAQLETDKLTLKQQVTDWQRETDITKKQAEMERQRCAELERVLANERRNIHTRDLNQSEVARENEDLRSEVDRLNLRLESMQAHIDQLQILRPSSS